MRKKVLIIGLIIAVLGFMDFLHSTAFSGDNEEKSKYFESCIVKEIAKCDSKSALLSSSKSEHLKDYARMEALKAEFLKAEKEILVKEMVEMQIEQKHYKVELFLNRRFRETQPDKNQ